MCLLENGAWIGPFLRDWDKYYASATPEERARMLGPFAGYAAEHGNLDMGKPQRQSKAPVKIAQPFRIDRTTVKAGERVYLRQALAATIPPREREMVELRLQGNTLTEIGEAYGITKQRVNQILKRAIKEGIRNQ